MNQKILSIIIPMFNSEKFISLTLNNLLKAKKEMNDIEILLIDDGSKDKTRFICSNYVKRFNFIKYFYKKNGGIDDARNFGISKAKGRFLFFHDHDDYFNISKLNEIKKIVKNNKADLFLFSTNMFKDGNIYNKCFPITNRVNCYLDREEDINDLIYNLFNVKRKNELINDFGVIWSTVVRADFVRKHHLTFKIRCDFEDDQAFIFETLLKKPKIFLSELIIYQWNFRNQSTSNNFSISSNYLCKVHNYIEFIKNSLNDHNFDIDSQRIINNMQWLKNRDFLVLIKTMKNKLTYLEFKKICKTNNVLYFLGKKVYFKMSFNQKIIRLLAILKNYYLLYILAKKT